VSSQTHAKYGSLNEVSVCTALHRKWKVLVIQRLHKRSYALCSTGKLENGNYYVNWWVQETSCTVRDSHMLNDWTEVSSSWEILSENNSVLSLLS
jgi:hypothetical protein